VGFRDIFLCVVFWGVGVRSCVCVCVCVCVCRVCILSFDVAGAFNTYIKMCTRNTYCVA
jgi:hypothetical protein